MFKGTLAIGAIILACAVPQTWAGTEAHKYTDDDGVVHIGAAPKQKTTATKNDAWYDELTQLCSPERTKAVINYSDEMLSESLLKVTWLAEDIERVPASDPRLPPARRIIKACKTLYKIEQDTRKDKKEREEDLRRLDALRRRR